jgi:hypothetical protein
MRSCVNAEGGMRNVEFFINPQITLIYADYFKKLG